jgi:hypothetical protein
MGRLFLFGESVLYALADFQRFTNHNYVSVITSPALRNEAIHANITNHPYVSVIASPALRDEAIPGHKTNQHNLSPPIKNYL